MHHKHRQFVRHVREHLKKYNGKLILGRGQTVNCGGYRCAGYFEDSKVLIKVGKNSTTFLETLLHEYSHFLQWIQKSKIYKKADKYCLVMDDWFAGKKYTDQQIKKAFYWVRKMERECEQYAVRLIDKYELPIDKKKYIKGANCYIYSHFLMEEQRKYWTYKKNPYSSPSVQRVMPSTFKVLSHKTIPNKVYKALLSCV
jgi:hypothetical protein